MKPIRFTPAALLWLLVSAVASGQIIDDTRPETTPGGIQVPAEADPFKIIEATYSAPSSIPEGAGITPIITASEGVDFREPVRGLLMMTAPPGEHSIKIVFDWIKIDLDIDWDARTYTTNVIRGEPEFSASFTVRGPPKPKPPDVPDPPEPEDPPDPPIPTVENRWVILLTNTPDGHADLDAAIQAKYPRVQVEIDAPARLPSYERLRPRSASLPYAFLIRAPPDEASELVRRDEFVSTSQVLGWLTAETPTTTDVDRIAYVHEQRDGPVPVEIMGAIKEIASAGKIGAITIEDDETALEPWQQTARDAARKEGLPSLVLMNGDEVLRVVDVDDYDSVMEAIK